MKSIQQPIDEQHHWATEQHLQLLNKTMTTDSSIYFAGDKVLFSPDEMKHTELLIIFGINRVMLVCHKDLINHRFAKYYEGTQFCERYNKCAAS